VRNPALLDGLPQSVIDAALQNALDDNLTANNRTGPWIFRFDGATADFVVAFASNRQLRQAVFNATVNMASNGSQDNSPVVVRMLNWRQQKASLLGFKGSFAQFKFARMVSNLLCKVCCLFAC
jgi:Zn-dependent oligopeptidase